jgi:hypothetical protein
MVGVDQPTVIELARQVGSANAQLARQDGIASEEFSRFLSPQDLSLGLGYGLPLITTESQNDAIPVDVPSQSPPNAKSMSRAERHECKRDQRSKRALPIVAVIAGKKEQRGQAQEEIRTCERRDGPVAKTVRGIRKRKSGSPAKGKERN